MYFGQLNVRRGAYQRAQGPLIGPIGRNWGTLSIMGDTFYIVTQKIPGFLVAGTITNFQGKTFYVGKYGGYVPRPTDRSEYPSPARRRKRLMF